MTIALVVATAWFAVVLVWALRPQTDTVPVGIDYTLVPPVAVTQDVECDSIFASSAVNGSLPTLTPQPDDAPALGFQRGPCELVQRNGRIVFGLDVLFYLVVVAASVATFTRRGREAEARLLPA